MQMEQREWLRYKNPTDEPDAYVEKDMNTFISLTREMEAINWKEVMSMIKKIESTARQVEAVWSDALAKNDSLLLQRALHNLETLKQMCLEKIDAATVHSLRFVESKLTGEKQEFLLEEEADNLRVGLWASYSEIRPTRKVLAMEKVGLTLEIAKLLLQQSEKYVYRFIRMPINTYNKEAYSAENNTVPDTAVDVAAVADGSVAAAAHFAAGAAATETANSGASAAAVEGTGGADDLAAQAASGDADAVVPAAAGSGEEKAGDASADAEAAAAAAAAAEAAVVEAAALEAAATAAAAQVRASPYAKYVVGDLIYFDILLTPPHSFEIRAKKWSMRSKSSNCTTIRQPAQPYPTSQNSKLSIKLADGVVISEGMRLCVWDAENSCWTEDGISDFQFSEATRTVQCQITTVGIFAIVKSRTMDFPYKSWHLSPVLGSTIERNSLYPTNFEEHARLSIHTQQHHVVIDIIGMNCKLIKPDSSLFSDVCNIVMTPGNLLSSLMTKGVYLLPTNIDLYNVDGAKPKRAEVEQRVMDEVSQGISSLEYTSSPWNQTILDAQIGVCVRESTTYSCPGETFDYECVLAEHDEVTTAYTNTPELGIVPAPAGVKFTLVFGNEYGDRKLYSHVPRPNEVPHIGLSYTLQSRVTLECMERQKHTNQKFQKTVNTLLSLIRPYSLS